MVKVLVLILLVFSIIATCLVSVIGAVLIVNAINKIYKEENNE